MKLQPPKTSYEEMIFKALLKKTLANHRPKGKSQRDEIREFNATHTTQLNLRPRLRRDNQRGG